MTEELVKRLRSTYTRPYKHEATTLGARVSTISVSTFYHNPDGPEAADAIEALQAENFMLAAGACINPGQHALVGDEHGNFVCTAYEALQAEERAHADALAQIAHLMSELQAHKDALAQAAPKP
jgi:hypothetical protein